MKIIPKAIIAAIVSATVPLIPASVRAELQEPAIVSSTEITPYFRGRAQNLARQAAIKANGGLSEYRPASSMFGPASQAPYSINPDGSITFVFTGSPPDVTIPTVETRVTVTPTNQVIIDDNGPVRSVGGPDLEIIEESNEPVAVGLGDNAFLIEAQNLARQAAIEENGGLEEYRPESSMFGPVEQAPYVVNPDSSVTFIFTGSPPASAEPTTITAVTITRNDQVMLEFNREIQ